MKIRECFKCCYTEQDYKDLEEKQELRISLVALLFAIFLLLSLCGLTIGFIVLTFIKGPQDPRFVGYILTDITGIVMVIANIAFYVALFIKIRPYKKRLTIC
jgi:hypothetical protein